jgi:hypothetical protein
LADDETSAGPDSDAAGPALDKSAGTPREIWNDYFSKRKPEPKAVAQLLLRLHERKQYEHVIAAIEAALLNGQSQPWMYDVLALSMQIAGRPRQEVERALLSRIDFTADDVPSMLYSAAYLKRFGAEKQALVMYRQASSLAPTQPEPYVLALKLAGRLKDFDAVGWAAAGILTYAWGKNHAQLHQQAEDAVAEARQELIKTGDNEKAKMLEALLGEAKKRDVVLKLSWAGPGDLDLLVDEPPGSVCSYDNPQTVGGGVLVHDGYGPAADNCYEEYICAFAIPGAYRIRVHHVLGDIVGQRAQLSITLYRGTPHETTRVVSVPVAQNDQVVRLVVKRGRRTDLATPAPKEEPTVKRRPAGLREKVGLASRPFVLGQIAGPGGAQALPQFGAVGYTPVIDIVSEGVTSSAMAIVSADRRFVRLNMSPQFSALADVFTFSFVNSGGNPTGNPGTGR